MEATPQRVVMLLLDNGDCPVAVWLRSVRDPVTRARITRQIDKLGRGLFGVWRGVGESVTELKLDFGPGYWVYYVRLGGVTVVLLSGGDKSSQSQDIKTARDLWQRFEVAGFSEERLRSWPQNAERAQQNEEVAASAAEIAEPQPKQRRKKTK